MIGVFSFGDVSDLSVHFLLLIRYDEYDETRRDTYCRRIDLF